MIRGSHPFSTRTTAMRRRSIWATVRRIPCSLLNLRWSSVEPSVLGTLFVRSLDPDKRSQIGAHYTSKEDILLIVEPVLMAPLRRRWDEVRQQAVDLARRRDEARPGRARTARQTELEHLLLGFAEELAGVRVLDPACGTMHFGLVAFDLFAEMYREELAHAGQPGWPEQASVANADEIPAAIIQHNLFGIDIDLRAVQLSALTLYVKAKRMNKQAVISDHNLACADVLPLDGARLGTFIREMSFRPIYERLIRKLWERLEEINQLGSLLRLEKEIGAMGISNESNVIVYGAVSRTTWNAVMFWVLETMGCNSALTGCAVHFYDGGIERWLAEGGKLDQAETKAKHDAEVAAQPPAKPAEPEAEPEEAEEKKPAAVAAAVQASAD